MKKLMVESVFPQCFKMNRNKTILILRDVFDALEHSEKGSVLRWKTFTVDGEMNLGLPFAFVHCTSTEGCSLM